MPCSTLAQGSCETGPELKQSIDIQSVGPRLLIINSDETLFMVTLLTGPVMTVAYNPKDYT